MSSSLIMNKYPSWRLICTVITFPVTLLIQVIKYYTVGPIYQRCKTLKSHITISVLSLVLGLEVGDYHFFSYKATRLVTLFSWLFPKVVRELPGFGENYDKNSFWLVKQPNRSKDDPVIIYIHGGAYILQLNPFQFASIATMYLLVDQEKQKKISILMLDYRLATDNFTFPSIRDDLNFTYENLTKRDKNSNILFMGDSCGGNLALLYLQYLKSLEDSRVVYPQGLILDSPWVKSKATPDQYTVGQSYFDFREKDYLKYELFSNQFVMDIIYGQNADFNSALVSPLPNENFKLEEWKDIPTMNKDVLIITGEHEVFRDDILTFAEVLYGCKLLKDNRKHYLNSDGKYQESLYSYHTETRYGKVGAQVFVEPHGIHDVFAFLENTILNQLVDREIRERYSNHLDELDHVEYFGLTKIVEFINRVV